MLLLQIKSTDALLECQERLIDFSAVHLRLLVSVHCVGAALAAGEIDERYLAVRLHPLRCAVHQLHLEYGVRAGGLRVGASLPRGACQQPVADGGHDILHGLDGLLCEADDVHLLLVILSADQLLAFVKEIVEFPAINLVEGQVELQVLVHLQKLYHIVGGEDIEPGNCAITGAHHGESFSRASLSIGKTGGLCPLEGLHDDRQHTILVDGCVVSI